MAKRKDTIRAEFGDFQTPLGLCQQVVKQLAGRIDAPATIIEPTCGVGSFLMAARHRWPDAELIGFDCNEHYLQEARRRLGEDARFVAGSFFDTDWGDELERCREPILLLGNPPWVTNAGLGVLGSKNLPQKSNFQGRRGFDAKTGKANFDISEWMLVRLLEAADGRQATVAMLLKTSVARRVLTHAWKTGVHLRDAEIRSIDAQEHFGASVAACLLIATLSPTEMNKQCRCYALLGDDAPRTVIGWRDGFLVADVEAYDRSKHLWGDCPFKWRSGVKHDCSKVMEFRVVNEDLINGYGERVDIEPDYVFPLLKTSEVAKVRIPAPRRAVLVTQRNVGEDTHVISQRAPRTWAYLQAHASDLDRRGSSIYRNRAPFSVFGVGDYTFEPWKIAISGFYKQTRFSLIPPHQGKPVVVDDATYMLGFESAEYARLAHRVLNSEPAQDFFAALTFMDAKRPITVDLLRRLDMRKVAEQIGVEQAFEAICASLVMDRHIEVETPLLF